MNPFANNVAVIFRRDTFVFVINLITGIIVARSLGPAAMGVWVILSMVPSYAEAFGRTKADLAAVFFIGQGRFRLEDVIGSLNAIGLLSAGFVVGLAILGADQLYAWLFSRESGNFQAYFMVMLLQIPLQFLYLNYAYFHIAQEHVHHYAWMSLIQEVVKALVSLGLLIGAGLGLWAVIFGALAGTFSGLVYGWMVVDRTNWSRKLPGWSLARSMLRYGAHFYFAGIIGQFQQFGTQTLSVSWLSASQMAFLSQGQSVSKLLQKVVDPLNTMLFPRVSSQDPNQSEISSCKAFRVSCLLLGAGGAGLLLMAKPLIVLLYGKSFEPSAMVIQYLMPGIVAFGVGSTLISYFNGTGRAALIPRVTIGPVLFQLGLSWVFLKCWGLPGAAIAISIGSMTQSIALIVLFLQISKTSFHNLIPGWDDVRILKTFMTSTILARR